jgi:hypothetical protein
MDRRGPVIRYAARQPEAMRELVPLLLHKMDRPLASFRPQCAHSERDGAKWRSGHGVGAPVYAHSYHSSRRSVVRVSWAALGLRARLCGEPKGTALLTRC